MAKAKKMKKAELKQYRALLLKKKEEVLDEIKTITKDSLSKSPREASGDLSGYSFHMADVATDNYDREFSLNIASGENKILYLIDEALKRIDDGSYGNCLECEERIRVSRLKAIPWAELCIRCQGEEEKKNNNNSRHPH